MAEMLGPGYGSGGPDPSAGTVLKVGTVLVATSVGLAIGWAVGD